MILYLWGAEPDMWSGAAEEDLERWRVEHAIWAATAGQGDDPPPAAPGRDA